MVYFCCVAVVNEAEDQTVTDITRGLRFHVVKLKLITADTEKPMNQSELEENTCSWYKTRKNACGKDQNWFSFDFSL